MNLFNVCTNVVVVGNINRSSSSSSSVEDKLVPMQCDMDVTPKALLKVVRCNCKMGCDTLRCSCPKSGMECSTGCGEGRVICGNVYENITEDNEYEEDT